jgi:hypothetical protein
LETETCTHGECNVGIKVEIRVMFLQAKKCPNYQEPIIAGTTESTPYKGTILKENN